MAKLLIDSHVLIWLLYEPKRIGALATQMLAETETVFVSTLSLWELTLKFSKHKLAYSPEELIEGVKSLGADRLPLHDNHLLQISHIDLPHKDPFDRTLIAQSEAENCILLTADQNLLNSTYRTADVTK